MRRVPCGCCGGLSALQADAPGRRCVVAGRRTMRHCRRAASRVPEMFSSRLAAAHRYFLAAGLVLSCFGFRFFLSFFCELFPLPMFSSPVGWRAPCGPFHAFNRHKSPPRSIGKGDFFGGLPPAPHARHLRGPSRRPLGGENPPGTGNQPAGKTPGLRPDFPELPGPRAVGVSESLGSGALCTKGPLRWSWRTGHS